MLKKKAPTILLVSVESPDWLIHLINHAWKYVFSTTGGIRSSSAVTCFQFQGWQICGAVHMSALCLLCLQDTISNTNQLRKGSFKPHALTLGGFGSVRLVSVWYTELQLDQIPWRGVMKQRCDEAEVWWSGGLGVPPTSGGLSVGEAGGLMLTDKRLVFFLLFLFSLIGK